MPNVRYSNSALHSKYKEIVKGPDEGEGTMVNNFEYVNKQI
jgi:hypothetical protein